jgi:hypothetical protein
MARVYFLLRLQPEKLPGVIDQQLASTQRWLSNTIEKEKGLSRPATFENLTYHFRVSQIQSMLDWLTWLKAQHQISKFQRGEQ